MAFVQAANANAAEVSTGMWSFAEDVLCECSTGGVTCSAQRWRAMSGRAVREESSG
jgi:hypothetical protein